MPPAAGKAVPAAKGGRFVIQVAALSEEGSAESLKKKLAAAGVSASVTPVQTAKAPQGKIKAKLTMAWDDTIMYSGAKLSIFVQPMNKTVTATLPPRPSDGAIELTMTLDDAVGMAPFAVGPISITSGPKPATQAPTMPVESLVASTLATAAAVTAVAAQAMAPPPAPPRSLIS